MSISARSLREMERMAADGSLLLDPPYQRGDVWTTLQRVNLIRSLLLRVPIAAVIVNERGLMPTWRDEEVWYAVIDGKQRITTALLWFRGKLEIPASWLPPQYLPEGSSDLVTYNDLTRAGQMSMDRSFIVPLAAARLNSLALEAEVYGLVNSAGTPQTEEDLARARSLTL